MVTGASVYASKATFCMMMKKKKNHYILPAKSGLIRCLVPHGRAS